LLSQLLSRLAIQFFLSLNHLLDFFRDLATHRTALRPTFFRPSFEGLEPRWCPSIYRWNAGQADNWNVQADWEVQDPNTGIWVANNTGRAPSNADTAQFDGTSTKLCTVSASVTVVELDMKVGGAGQDQILLASGQSLEGKMVWSVENVQIGFGATSSILKADGGSSIKSFTFDGAGGLFDINPGAGGGVTTWSTSAASSTKAQIYVEGGTFDVKSTGTCTSTYAGQDVWVTANGTLNFDYGNSVTVSDLFDNNGDNAGFFYIGSGRASGLGKATTSNTTFKVVNKMPIRNTGSLTVDTGELDFYRSVAGATKTDGLSYFMTTDLPGPNPPAPTTILKNGATLLCDQGYEQGFGSLTVADGTSVYMKSNLAGDSSVYFLGGTIAFPGGTTYGRLNFTLPTAAGVNFDIGSVTMKVNPSALGVWNADQITTNGYFNFPTGSSMSLTINNSGGGVMQGYAYLLLSSNNLVESGTWGTVTNNVAGTTTTWTTLGDYKISNAGTPSPWDPTLLEFLVANKKRSVGGYALAAL
jgi:hypothetical protein